VTQYREASTKLTNASTLSQYTLLLKGYLQQQQQQQQQQKRWRQQQLKAVIEWAGEAQAS
jgi:hypothetical protein